jgi:hypothetical protein
MCMPVQGEADRKISPRTLWRGQKPIPQYDFCELVSLYPRSLSKTVWSFRTARRRSGAREDISANPLSGAKNYERTAQSIAEHVSLASTCITSLARRIAFLTFTNVSLQILLSRYDIGRHLAFKESTKCDQFERYWDFKCGKWTAGHKSINLSQPIIGAKCDQFARYRDFESGKRTNIITRLIGLIWHSSRESELLFWNRRLLRSAWHHHRSILVWHLISSVSYFQKWIWIMCWSRSSINCQYRWDLSVHSYQSHAVSSDLLRTHENHSTYRTMCRRWSTIRIIQPRHPLIEPQPFSTDCKSCCKWWFDSFVLTMDRKTRPCISIL